MEGLRINILFYEKLNIKVQMDHNIKQQLKSIKIVYLALVLGVFFFIIVAILLINENGAFISVDEQNMPLYIVIANVSAFAGIFSGIILFKKKMQSVKKLELYEKINIFRIAVIMRGALMESPCFLFAVGYLLSGSSVFLIEAVAGLLLMIFFFPTNSRIAQEVKHNSGELL